LIHWSVHLLSIMASIHRCNGIARTGASPIGANLRASFQGGGKPRPYYTRAWWADSCIVGAIPIGVNLSQDVPVFKCFSSRP
jgi:hypothetical protein